MQGPSEDSSKPNAASCKARGKNMLFCEKPQKTHKSSSGLYSAHYTNAKASQRRKNCSKCPDFSHFKTRDDLRKEISITY